MSLPRKSPPGQTRQTQQASTERETNAGARLRVPADRARETAAVDFAVRMHAVRKAYGHGAAAVHALAGLSMDFPVGSFTAVMGPSGSGKSTLLQCAAGLDRPDSGQVLLTGVDLTSLDETNLTRLRRERIGFVFQAFNLIPSLTAEKNVQLPLRLGGSKPRAADVAAALAAVGLADRMRHRPAELSGGQQQRVAIARALISGPAVLFADEPTGALDTKGSRDVLALLRGLVDRERRTVIMVTHDPVAASYADNVVFLRDGRIAGQLARPTAEQVAVWLAQVEAPSC